MNNAIKVMLNDPKVIEELMKDPEIQIRLKEALIDTAVKRFVKDKISHELAEATRKEVENFTRPGPGHENDIFAHSDYWTGPRFTESTRTKIKNEIHDMVESEIQSQIMGKIKTMDFIAQFKDEVARAYKEISVHDWMNEIRNEIKRQVNMNLRKVLAVEPIDG